MKSKKPFLIVCAAAVTLALALPFMGVFAFAASDPVVVSLSQLNDYNCQVQYTSLSDSTTGTASNNGVSTPVPFYFVPGVVYSLVASYLPGSGGWRNGSLKYGQVFLSTNPDNPTVIDYPVTSSFSIGGGVTSVTTYYVKVDVPPDPLAPVSDGMDTMISVFGDVIDYIINTPDVAIFVAISVASCAIIPMGIILIKKLIKGY